VAIECDLETAAFVELQLRSHAPRQSPLSPPASAVIEIATIGDQVREVFFRVSNSAISLS
jgi:hypothetical protein